jgi:hypothetical protein
MQNQDSLRASRAEGRSLGFLLRILVISVVREEEYASKRLGKAGAALRMLDMV